MAELTGFDVVFRHPEYLWAIVPAVLVCAALLALGYVAVKRAWQDNPLLRLHNINMAPRIRTYVWRWLAISAVLSLLTAVAAEPVQRQIIKEPIYAGVRVAFLFDVSFSMLYAQDVPPFPNRLVAGKSIISGFGDMTQKDPELRGSYKLAIIPFAGSAITYQPFSTSVVEFTESIDAINETTINHPGTDLLQPILEYERLLKGQPKDEHTLDIAVLISDGGKGEGAHKDLPQIQLARMRMPQALFFTVGIGSKEIYTLPNGEKDTRTIPVELKMYDSAGVFLGHVLFDEPDPQDPAKTRKVKATSELDERILTQVAGDPTRYFFYEGKARLLGQLKDIIVKNRVQTDTKLHERLTSVAEWFLYPALFIMMVFVAGYAQRLFFFLLRLFQGLVKYRPSAR